MVSCRRRGLNSNRAAAPVALPVAKTFGLGTLILIAVFRQGAFRVNNAIWTCSNIGDTAGTTR
jgi:hypothetical protein